MILHEIRRFGLTADCHRDIFFDAPASLSGVLADAGIISGDGYAERCAQAARLLGGGCSLVAEIDPDGALISKESIVLSFGRISAPVTVFINGVPVANVAAGHALHRLGIKHYLRGGKNRVELRLGAPESRDVILYPPRIEAYDDRVIEAVSVRQTHTEDGCFVELAMTTSGYGSDSRAVATLVSAGGSVSYANFVGDKATFNIKSPVPWWPGRLGNHSLYKLSVNLYSRGEVADSRDGYIGIRTLDVTRTDALTDRLAVNGEEFIPVMAELPLSDELSPLTEGERARKALARMALSGVNAICFTDELPTDRLLSDCDELGLLVALRLNCEIPEDGATRTLALRELYRRLAALSLHPSLAIVTSCCECDVEIERTVREALPSVKYIRDFRLNVIEPIPTLPAEATLSEFVPEGERNIFSPTMVRCTLGDVASLVSHISREHLMPYGTEETRYVSGIVAAASQKREYLAALTAEKRCGVMLPAFIDPSPLVSPSTLDYRLRPKAPWYYLSRVTRPTIAFAKVEGTRVEFFVHNLQRKVYIGKLNYSLVDTRGSVLIRDEIDVSVGSTSSESVLAIDLTELIANRRDNAVLMYTLSGKDALSYSDTALFVSERELKLCAPGIKYDLTGACNDFTLTLSASAYARAVEITFLDEDVILSDNYFDLTPTAPVRLAVTSSRPTAIESLWNKIKIRSLFDVGRG